ncbi:hypothetical protein JSCD1_35860 [Clostridioides difficile]|nr:hypothetical protein JSCD1_35860 [Clostridioides difficile]
MFIRAIGKIKLLITDTYLSISFLIKGFKGTYSKDSHPIFKESISLNYYMYLQKAFITSVSYNPLTLPKTSRM